MAAESPDLTEARIARVTDEFSLSGQLERLDESVSWLSMVAEVLWKRLDPLLGESDTAVGLMSPTPMPRSAHGRRISEAIDRVNAVERQLRELVDRVDV